MSRSLCPLISTKALFENAEIKLATHSLIVHLWPLALGREKAAPGSLDETRCYSHPQRTAAKAVGPGWCDGISDNRVVIVEPGGTLVPLNSCSSVIACLPYLIFGTPVAYPNHVKIGDVGFCIYVCTIYEAFLKLGGWDLIYRAGTIFRFPVHECLHADASNSVGASTSS